MTGLEPVTFLVFTKAALTEVTLLYGIIQKNYERVKSNKRSHFH
jgi:hypothetical protein